MLPWLCWGGWSNPHHPHPNPHFVFAESPLLDEAHHVYAADPHVPAEQDPLAGVARPDTLLIALLVLLIPLFRIASAPHIRYFTRWLAQLWSRTPTLAVPTPPPRALLSIHIC